MAVSAIPPIVADDFVDVDLDAMNVEELTAEQAECWKEIQQIEGQLGDPTFNYDLEQTEYVAWRKRANWALRYRKIELHQIASALHERRNADALEKRRQEKAERAAIKERNKLENGWRPFDPERAKRKSAVEAVISVEENERRRIEAQQRRALVVNALRGNGGTDGLLIRLSVAFHHIWGGDRDLPDTATADDRAALKELSVYLRDCYGVAAIKGARTGKLTAESVIEVEGAS